MWKIKYGLLGAVAGWFLGQTPLPPLFLAILLVLLGLICLADQVDVSGDYWAKEPICFCGREAYQWQNNSWLCALHYYYLKRGL